MNNEQPYSYREQILWVLLIEAMIITGLILIATFFWTSVCTDSLKSCIAGGEDLAPLTFLLLSVLRPFVFTPFAFMAVIAGPAFGTTLGTVLTIIGGLASTLIIAAIGRALGTRLATPWLNTNLPDTSRLIRQQDYKIAFFLRLIPLVPYDLASFFFGALGFRWRHIIWTTLLGSIPEVVVFARMAGPETTFYGAAFDTVALIGVAIVLPLLIAEFVARRSGKGMWQQSIAAYKELLAEVTANNAITKRTTLHPERIPVVLLYGFFSSRRAMGVLERMLHQRGYDVISFNQGGLLGTFFTSSILEGAALIDEKIQRQVTRHGIRQVHIVAHSKGGLVALWWLLKMGGDRMCSKVITLGTPFAGSRLTYLALVTPLGLFWRDMWQMRPGSAFLRQLHRATVPEECEIHCFHSVSDAVSTGKSGLFQPVPASSRVHDVAMDDVNHFGFLSQPKVADRIAEILGDPKAEPEKSPATTDQAPSAATV
ncbi:MAG: hypothetical protein RIQ81_2575 [Pseudomonadota bacterium]|jgi:uncharacterized membrane protein YdjX (TVP38/TMEM64 family)/pimeloyl-ACP methyl ester carboxylesterase